MFGNRASISCHFCTFPPLEHNLKIRVTHLLGYSTSQVTPTHPSTHASKHISQLLENYYWFYYMLSLEMACAVDYSAWIIFSFSRCVLNWNKHYLWKLTIYLVYECNGTLISAYTKLLQKHVTGWISYIILNFILN